MHMCVRTCKHTYTQLNQFNSADNREILVKTKWFLYQMICKADGAGGCVGGAAPTVAVGLRGEFTDERCPRIVGIH